MEQDQTPNPLVAALLDLIGEGGDVKILSGNKTLSLKDPDLQGNDLKRAVQYAVGQLREVVK